ncbi:MAG: hypothetical protein WAW17_17760 [Rhodococcus sp. (in: high G+C Gram-positive bacteria)]|uniref:hypothetical protein n=1 Tax=Rhodococcus sp. TaxID=1831 RepID=UPI003BB0E3AA
MNTIREFEEVVTDKVVTGLHGILADYQRRGIGVSELGDPDDWAARILEAVPVSHPWWEQFGEFWSETGS